MTIPHTDKGMRAQKLAQEVVSRYLSLLDQYETHSTNVQHYLRGPVQALTLAIFDSTNTPEGQIVADVKPPPAATAVAVDAPKDPPAAAQTNRDQAAVGDDSKPSATATTTTTAVTATTNTNNNIPDWRDYLSKSSSNEEDLPDLGKVDAAAYEKLSRRSKARLEAFLMGVSLAVPNEQADVTSPPTSGTTTPAVSIQDQTSGSGARAATELVDKARGLILDNTQNLNITLAQGLAGFGSSGGPTVVGHVTEHSTTSSSRAISKAPLQKFPQMLEAELATRLELYIRTCCRVVAQKQECVVAAEPTRALKARARSVVLAFVDTVDTVKAQNVILTRLLQCLTMELLAEEVLAEGVQKLIRQLVQDYIQSVSFASLAFLTSPEISAEARLTPMLMKYLRYLQQNWDDCVEDCEVERMLCISIHPELRRTFKTIEFHSIGHLLEVCRGFREELHHIELPPGTRFTMSSDIDNAEEVRQAIRDLKRETITINGHYLPPVSSRKELVDFLSQSLHSRTLTSAPLKKSRRQTGRSRKYGKITRTGSDDKSESETSGSDGDLSSGFSSKDELSPTAAKRLSNSGPARRSRFRLSTVDFLTKRLLLAASRTGTGGDAYFVVRDLFGDDDVAVVPSKQIATPYGRTARPGSIEIIVKLASITIRCHGSFDVYPSSLVGEVEPLIQLHTTTSETIALQEVRASDSDEALSGQSNGARKSGKKDKDDSDDEDEAGTVMVVQERRTERTGWRTLSIRPALYEKFDDFSTPS